MRCFIHINDEAVAVCKKCGKAMCGNCSAYTNHSGICPECVRNDYIQEHGRLSQALRENKKSVVICAIIAIAIAVLSIALAIAASVYLLVFLIIPLILGIKIITTLNRRKPITQRLNFLDGEIEKLGRALQRNVAII